jgi:hypothetical protein
MVAAQRALGDRWPAVRAEMLALLPPDGAPFTLEPPYLLIVARRQRAAV